MEYTEQELNEAFMQDELARLLTENHSLFALSNDRKPAYAGVYAGPEGEGVTFTHDDIDGARHELASLKPGLGPEDVEAAVLALTGGEKDPESQARAIVALTGMKANEIMRLTLPCKCCSSRNEVGLAAPPGESMAERRALARKGHALPDGSYPIPDRKHLHSAAVLAASGHGDVAAARNLIRKRAAELGVDVSTLPGFEGGPEPERRVVKKKRGHAQRGQRAASQGSGEGAPGYPGSDSGGEGPSGGEMAASSLRGYGSDYVKLSDSPVDYYVALAAEENVSSGPLKAHFDFQVHDTGSSRDPSPRLDPEAEVRRYLAMCGEKPYGANRSISPKSAAARRRAEERELAGGRPQRY